MATPLSAIMLDAKDLADMLGNPIVQDPTWRRWINQGTERLYRMLVVKAPARFHVAGTFTLTGLGNNSVAVAGSFRQMREQGVTKDPTVPGLRRSLLSFNFAARDAQGQLPGWGYGRELAYDIIAGTVPGSQARIVIEPEALCAGNYAYYFLAGPVPWDTAGSQDALDIMKVLEPYVDFIAHWAAIKGLLKRDDTETAASLKDDLKAIAEEIQAEFNEGSEPATIVDVEQTGGTFRR